MVRNELKLKGVARLVEEHTPVMNEDATKRSL